MSFLLCGKFTLNLDRPLIMGIVNVTPDSFSDGGKFLARDAAIAHAHQLLEEGADILDIGGESTRPGAAPVSLQAELDRVMPVLEAMIATGKPVSVDTLKPEVMQAAIHAGVAMVNDVNALQADGALQIVAASNVAVCLMHKLGTPATMQGQPQYRDVVNEVRQFLSARIEVCANAGIASNRIVIDPGFGFGKTTEHNLQLLNNLHEFCELGVPVLAGLSRKNFLGEITSTPVGQRLPASLAAALIAVQRGAAIMRVHDVKKTIEALAVLRAVRG